MKERKLQDNWVHKVKKVMIDKSQETGIEGQGKKGNQDKFKLDSRDLKF